MRKSKLIQTRNKKDFSQQYMAENMHMDVSNYNRRESGQAKINQQEWEKLSQILQVPIEDIYESEESNFFVFKDSSIGNYLGTNHIYSIPEYFLENQRKYIQKLEEENERLRGLGGEIWKSEAVM